MLVNEMDRCDLVHYTLINPIFINNLIKSIWWIFCFNDTEGRCDEVPSYAHLTQLSTTKFEENDKNGLVNSVFEL